MADTVGSIITQVARDLGQLKRVGNEYEFSATSGSATTIGATFFASTQLDDQPDEDFFKNHAAQVIYDAGGAGASPEGRWGTISAYTGTTFTLDTLTDAVAAGDKFVIISQSLWPVSSILAALNRGLKDLGVMSLVDRSLTTASNQTEYSLPAGVVDVLDVRVPSTTDTNDNRYVSAGGWYLAPPTTTLTTAPILYIPQQSADYTIEIWYNGIHPTLTAYSDVVWKYIQKPLAVAATKVALLEQFVNNEGEGGQQHWKNMYAEALRQRDIGKMELPVKRNLRKQNKLTWPSRGGASDTLSVWPT